MALWFTTWPFGPPYGLELLNLQDPDSGHRPPATGRPELHRNQLVSLARYLLNHIIFDMAAASVSGDDVYKFEI